MEREKIKELEVNGVLNYQPDNFLTVAPQQFPALERWVRYLEDLKGKKESYS